jgi:hypothetical protein
LLVGVVASRPICSPDLQFSDFGRNTRSVGDAAVRPRRSRRGHVVEARAHLTQVDEVLGNVAVEVVPASLGCRAGGLVAIYTGAAAGSE